MPREWQNTAMTVARTVQLTLSELRALTSKHRRRAARPGEVVVLLAALVGACKHASTELRINGLAVRLQGETEDGLPFTLSCLLHDPRALAILTTAERLVAEQLVDGRTLAQVARLRGVSANTVKSQVRQIFRKLDVNSRVALARLLCA
jgi:DNA-binding CsgD family transcriptional regulator